MNPLKKLKEWNYVFPKTESNILSHQIAALETASEKLRKFCQTLPKCSNFLNCDTCEIMDKIIELTEGAEDLGLMQEELDTNITEYE